MKTILQCIAGGAVLAVLQLSIFPNADISFLAVILVAFFGHDRTARFFGLGLGIVVDLFSSVYGVHLFLFPLFAILCSILCARTITNRSFIGLQVTIALLWTAYWCAKFIIIFSLHTLFRVSTSTPNGIFSLSELRYFLIALCIHALIASVVYFFVNRWQSGRLYMNFST